MLPIPNMAIEEKMLSLNILPLEKQFIFRKALIVYKTLHNQTPNYMQSLLQTASSRYNPQKLLPPLPRIDLYKTSLAYSSSVVKNNIPDTVRQSYALSSFKRRLAGYLMSS